MINIFSFSLYIPLFNEEEGIEHLFNNINDGLDEINSKCDLNIIFVDDGSTDNTFQSLERYFVGDSFEIIRHESNKNLGGFLKTAINHCDSDYIGFLDSDCSYSVSTLLEMLDFVSDGYEIINASPYHPDGNVEGVSKLRIFPSKVVNSIYRFLTKKNIYTASSICKIYKTNLVRKIEIKNEGFVAIVELLTKSSILTENFKEFPCTLKGRLFGKSKMKFINVIVSHLKYIYSFYLFKKTLDRN